MPHRFKRVKSNVAVDRHDIPPSPDNSDGEQPPNRVEEVQVLSATTTSYRAGMKRSSSFFTLNISPLQSTTYASTVSKAHPFHASGSFKSLNDISFAMPDDDGECEAASATPETAAPFSDTMRSSWYKHDRDVYLAGLMFSDGRGLAATQRHCALCMSPHFSFSCRDCFSSGLLCRTCIIDSHASRPFHKTEKWNGHCFVCQSLKDIGLRIQLGHLTNDTCPHPVATPWKDFVIVDLDAQHTVNLSFCGCPSGVDHARQLLHSCLYPATSTNPKSAATFRLLRYASLLSAEGNVSTWEMYQTIRHGTDNTGTITTPDRYHSLREMIRQWQHLTLLKRAAMGHNMSGVAAVRAGNLALLCPACPQFGINTVDLTGDERWLNTLFIGMDANFRLKRFDVSSLEKDPPLNNGGAYMVETYQYESFIRDFSEIAIQPKSGGCHDFKAIRDANVVAGKRVATNGIATVDCIRHGLKRPVSMTDVNQGEKYVHMDYALFSTLPSSTELDLVCLSYDIGCQYGINLWDRRKGLPPSLEASDHEPSDFTVLVPKFHLPAHIEDCRLNYSFNTTPGVGRTDGEAPERNWSYFDRYAGSTRQMGPGSRADTLDFLGSDLNWVKYTSMPTAMSRKLSVAKAQSEEQTKAFDELNSAMQEDNIRDWKAQVLAWEADKTQPNPYRLERENVPSEKAVRLRILKEEQQALLLGAQISLDKRSTPFTFLAAGLDLEELQHNLDNEASFLGDHSTDIQRTKVVKRGISLVAKLKAWIELQKLYFPEGASLQMQSEILGGEDAPSVKTTLYLPSLIPVATPCNPVLSQYEWDLRVAQAHDALDAVRTHIRSLTSFRKFSDRFFRGQKAGTRSQQLKASLQARIQYSADQYHRARGALLRLATRLNQKVPPTLQELDNKDLRHLAEGDFGQSEGDRAVSWIWKVYGVSHVAADHTELRNELRIEWCLSRARAARWSEEVSLVQEEMKRVVRFYSWKATQWEEIVERDQYKKLYVDYDSRLVDEGRRAYARRQALLYRSLLQKCRTDWKLPEVDMEKSR